LTGLSLRNENREQVDFSIHVTILAKLLDITVPPSLLARADEVIE
jgi:hypothetical protein